MIISVPTICSVLHGNSTYKCSKQVVDTFKPLCTCSYIKKNNHNTKQLTRCLCLDSPWQPTLPFSACASQGFHRCGLLFYQASPELSQTMRGEWWLKEDPLWAQHGANKFLFESQKRNQSQSVHRAGPTWGLLIKGKSEWFSPLGAAPLL